MAIWVWVPLVGPGGAGRVEEEVLRQNQRLGDGAPADVNCLWIA